MQPRRTDTRPSMDGEDVIGTTAKLIKLAPVIKEFKNRKVGFKVITTGQTEIDFEMMRDYMGDIKVDFAFQGKVEKSLVVLFVGRLVTEKGINELLEAARCWSTDTSLVIVGTGPLMSKVKSQEYYIFRTGR